MAVQGSLVFNNEVQIVTLKIYWPCKVYFSLTQNIFSAAFLFTRLFGVSGPLAVARLGTFFTGDDNTHFLLYYHYVTYIWVYFWMNPVSLVPESVYYLSIKYGLDHFYNLFYFRIELVLKTMHYLAVSSHFR